MAQHKAAVLWSEEALDDLDQVWAYYLHTAGPETAEKMVRDIHAGAQLLADHPLAGRSRREVRAGLRSLTLSLHVLFYRSVDQVVQIVRILDARQDLDVAFSDRP